MDLYQKFVRETYFPSNNNINDNNTFKPFIKIDE
jgi:hypothetical protein